MVKLIYFFIGLMVLGFVVYAFSPIMDIVTDLANSTLSALPLGYSVLENVTWRLVMLIIPIILLGFLIYWLIKKEDKGI